MKKKILCGVLSLCMLGSLLCACSENVTSGRYDYDLSEYVELKEWKNVKATYRETGVCTEEEIDEILFQVMLTYADFEKKEGKAELYDQVLCDYKIFYEGTELEEYTQSSYAIVLGSDNNGDIDRMLSVKLLGAEVGAEASVEYTFPEDDASIGSWAGMTVTCQVKVTGVCEPLVPECTDEFVQALGNGFPTVADFREQLRQDIIEQKETFKAEAVSAAFLDGVTVKKYPEQELESYRLAYLEQIVTAAEEMGVEYSEYLKDYLNTTEAEINKAAQKDAETRVKNDLACIYASRLWETKLTEKEYEQSLEAYYEEYRDQFESKEDFETYFGKGVLWESFVWDKTFRSILENAVRLEPKE